MITKDQIGTMTKEELLSADFREVWTCMLDMAWETAYKPTYDKVLAMFEPNVGVWAQRVRQSYDTKDEGIGDLVSLFDKEPALVKIMCWSRLTGCGIDQIDYAKYVHRHFARSILNLFGEPQDDGSTVIRNTRVR
jgi:hypothetical protein